MVEGRDARTRLEERDVRQAAAAVAASRTVTEVEAGEVAAARRRGRRLRLPPWLASVAIVIGVGVVWQLGSTLEWWSPFVLPSLGDVAAAVGSTIPTTTFAAALGLTASEIAASFVASLVIGFAIGALFWKAPYVGRIFEPYLVSFYSVPFVVLYPVMVVIIGLNRWPIIMLSAVMGTIPMALNTWIGLSSVPEVYWKLSASLQCSRRQTMLRVAIPAAGPIVLAGVRLAGIYALIGSVSMEFLLAPGGLGFQIRKNYETFQHPTMMVYVLVVLVIAAIVAFSISAVESRMLGKRRAS